MITLYTYRLPFNKPFESAKNSWSFREGVILRYIGDGTDIASEAAPLPGFSIESTGEVISALTTGAAELNELMASLTEVGPLMSWLDHCRELPSLQFAVSCLGLHLIHLRNRPAPASCPLPEDDRVMDVNAVIGLGTDKYIKQEIDRLWQDGARTFKIKCGAEPGSLPKLLTESWKKHPEITYRIDANRSWTLEKAAGMIDRFSHLPVEYCEEPFPFDRLSRFRELKNRVPLPLALDESITSVTMLEEIMGTESADVVILKPTILGNILSLSETCLLETTHSIRRVCTTSFESGAGRSSVARFASIVGSRNMAQGLDTGRFLKDDIYDDTLCRYSLLPPESWCVPFQNCRTENLLHIHTT